ncbi:MAG: hypothetical protein GY937_23165 [bacterium]|nr:hypothetical protein [bacterium]
MSGTASTSWPQQSSAPCSPCRNWESVQAERRAANCSRFSSEKGLDEVVAREPLSARIQDVPYPFLVDLEIPGDVRSCIPLLFLRHLVEVAKGLHVGFVIELPDGLERSDDFFEGHVGSIRPVSREGSFEWAGTSATLENE